MLKIFMVLALPLLASAGNYELADINQFLDKVAIQEPENPPPVSAPKPPIPEVRSQGPLGKIQLPSTRPVPSGRHFVRDVILDGWISYPGKDEEPTFPGLRPIQVPEQNPSGKLSNPQSPSSETSLPPLLLTPLPPLPL